MVRIKIVLVTGELVLLRARVCFWDGFLKEFGMVFIAD
jgi:hypothetical protein